MTRSRRTCSPRSRAQDRREAGGRGRRHLARHRRPRPPDARADRRGRAGGRRRPGHPPVPVQPRPAGVPRARCRTSTPAASTSRLDPKTEIMSAIGAKECIFNLNLAFLDPGDVALAADPGYPVYTGGPLLAGAEPYLMPLVARARLRPGPRRDPRRRRPPGQADVPQLPQQPDRGRRPRRVLRGGRGLRPPPRRPRRPRQRLQRDVLRRVPRAVVPRPPPAPRRSASRSSRSRRATT